MVLELEELAMTCALVVFLLRFHIHCFDIILFDTLFRPQALPVHRLHISNIHTLICPTPSGGKRFVPH